MGKCVIRVLCAAILGCFLATVGCGGDKKGGEAAQKSEQAQESSPAEPVEAKRATWEGEYDCSSGDDECRDDKMFGDGIYYSGTVFNTVVTSDVNVRSLPSTKGAVLFQVKKDTKAQILGISKDGWALLTTREVVPRRGWIFGQYVDLLEEGKKLASTEFSITGFKLTAQDSTTADLTGSYKINGVEKTLNFKAFKGRGQNFFTFFYDIYAENSHYSIIPGLYTWQSNNNRLTHRAFLTRVPRAVENGVEIWNWAAFTDDFKFYFTREDTKTLLFRAGDGVRLLPDVAVESFNLRAKTVTCYCPSDEEINAFYKGAEEMDGQIGAHGLGFAEDNPAPEADGGSPSVRVSCEVNIETGVRKITKAEWAYQ